MSESARCRTWTSLRVKASSQESVLEVFSCHERPRGRDVSWSSLHPVQGRSATHTRPSTIFPQAAGGPRYATYLQCSDGLGDLGRQFRGRQWCCALGSTARTLRSPSPTTCTQRVTVRG